MGALAAGWGRRVGAAAFILRRAGRAGTGAGWLSLGGGRAAAAVLRGRGRGGVTTLGDRADGR